MIRQDEWIFPFLYVLLPCKTPQIYVKFFNILKQLLPHLKVSNCIFKILFIKSLNTASKH